MRDHASPPETLRARITAWDHPVREDAVRDARHDIDWLIFIGTALAIVAVCVPLVLFPDAGARTVGAAFEFVTRNFGVAYIATSCAALILLAWLACGRFAQVRLGPDGCAPEFSTFSWAAMIFCGGIGSTVLYWGTIEWAYHFDEPPFSVAPRSDAALQWAISYPLFHWGITGWALYCLPAISIGYAYHACNQPSLRVSDACRAVIGSAADGALGRGVDLIFMVGLVGASATGVGLSAPLITAAISRFAAIPDELSMSLATVFVGTLLFAGSVYAGLDRGIRRLSNLNVAMALAFAAFVLLAGPTRFILEMTSEAVGFAIQNFVRMSTWTDALGESDFVERWTVFYWAWWLALGPFMGIFVSKISRGRTIREMVFGMLGYGTLGCWLFFCVLGHYALHLQLTGAVPVVENLGRLGAPTAIVEVLLALPSGRWLLPCFALLCLVFMATTYDSASYTLASCATRRLPADRHPARWHRVFWALSLGLLPATLLVLGGLRSLQTASVVVSLPLIAVVGVMSISLVKSLRMREARGASSSPTTPS
jgi:BCCT family betaine/carnitine transporter